MSVEPVRIAEHTRITAHTATALADLYIQFRSKPLIRALMTALVDRIQELEDVLWSVQVDTTLDNATGASLDQIGDILGFPRGTLASDDDYRPCLRAIILAHRSNGTANDIIAITRLLLGAASAFTYNEGYASILLDPHAVVAVPPVTTIARVLGQSKAGGVQMQMLNPPRVASLLFTCSSDRFVSESSATLGFGDEAESTGGYLNGVVSCVP